MTESLKDKVKQLVNEGNAREAISLLQNQADQGDGQAMYALAAMQKDGQTNQMKRKPFCGMAGQGMHPTQKKLKER